MRIALIAAMAHDRVIGKDNQMPWHLPEDLKHFKATTMGKPVVMGRKTFESIGRPLPGRLNLVISRQSDYAPDGVSVASSVEQAVEIAKAHGDIEELMIIGGGQLYRMMLPFAERLYLTHIDLAAEGDTRFPEWDDGSWQCIEQSQHTNDKGLSYQFCTYERPAQQG
ncbi:type 3 dihydrofolate reductase [Paraferrimonas sedimenticola]|uniref:Dihydrofolate reductase n=1 Tax=Paraferrimonas sedimenticola TaxID=375674 RepID=A0AA37W247_9GAMM|nr:type 3 dihydrofolate reductase [Paraferrimonas sedimenticola]GLP97347.1 dihydrofolate reductase [Paraferrimonas sedimenticola]